MRKRSYLTVRNLPDDVARELERQRKQKGVSLNQAVVDTLRAGLDLNAARPSNGLAALAGKWSKGAFATFDRHVREMNELIDEDDWR